MDATMISVVGRVTCPVGKLCGTGPLVAYADGLRSVDVAREDYPSYGFMKGELVVGRHIPDDHPLLVERRKRQHDRFTADRARNVLPGYFARLAARKSEYIPLAE